MTLTHPSRFLSQYFFSAFFLRATEDPYVAQLNTASFQSPAAADVSPRCTNESANSLSTAAATEAGQALRETRAESNKELNRRICCSWRQNDKRALSFIDIQQAVAIGTI